MARRKQKCCNADLVELGSLHIYRWMVVHDLINRIHNGEIHDTILDLSAMKRVLVFDLGGETLDITMHEIKRRDESSETLKVNESATNRYTLLGGDDFDEAVAQAMFERYLRQYAKNPNVVSQLQQCRDMIMAQLRTFAENVKLDLSMQCMKNSDYGSSSWDDDDEEIKINTGGSMGSIGYAYDDAFTRDEIEHILAQFMGNGLKYDDYKNISENTDTRNIIYPILDVLQKACAVLDTPDVKIDAVIVNGGMSKFYMITDRLWDFFGLEPIVALDSDQSVATGAAVYSYLLAQHSELQDDMTMLGEASSVTLPAAPEPAPRKIAIEWSRPKLNDALYIGVKNNAVQEIIPTGAELPYDSQIMTGFSIEPLQKRIDIPIKSRNLDGTYRIIASGNIVFSKFSSETLYVAFTIHMEESKIISMTAWTSYDVEGRDKLETGETQIAITNLDSAASYGKTAVPSSLSSGPHLDAKSEIKRLIKLCKKFTAAKIGYTASSIAQDIRELTKNIIAASNRADFVQPVFNALADQYVHDEAKMRLFTLSRRIANVYTPNDLKRLADICMKHLIPTINGSTTGYTRGTKVSSNSEAIYTLSICGSPEDMKCLFPLHEKYTQQCLYAHSRTHTAVAWILAKFSDDANPKRLLLSKILPVSANAVAVALRNNSDCQVPKNQREKTLNEILTAIRSRKLNTNSLSTCIVALGTMCDTKTVPSPFSSEKIQEVKQCIDSIAYNYPSLASGVERNCDVALKMINGEDLSVDDENSC